MIGMLKFEIFDHSWPWIEHLKGRKVTEKPKVIKRKASSYAGKYRKPNTSKVNLDKMKRCHRNRKARLEEMGEPLYRANF